jgi:acyl-CoA dehydrogenase
MHWAIWDAMFNAQNALEGVISNFPNRLVAALMRRVVFPLGRPYVIPSDKLGHEVARLLIEPSATRDRLTAGAYISRDPDDPGNLIERALAAAIAAAPVEAKIRAATRDGRLPATPPAGAGIEWPIGQATSAGIITAAEADVLREARELTERVIRVDDFAFDLGISMLEPSDDPADRAAIANALSDSETARRRVGLFAE